MMEKMYKYFQIFVKVKYSMYKFLPTKQISPKKKLKKY
jgi:hypothetical protein